MKINNITQTHGTNGYKAYIWLYVQCLVIESISFRQLQSETIHVGIKLLLKSQLQKTFWRNVISLCQKKSVLKLTKFMCRAEAHQYLPSFDETML